MTRHPATEGNDLRPRRVDADDDVTVPDGEGGRLSVSNLRSDFSDLLPNIQWVQSGGTPISIALNGGESVSVPDGQVWMVSISMAGYAIEIDGDRVTDYPRATGTYIQKIVFDGGRTIKNTGNYGMHISGWSISDTDTDLDFVTAINPTVPNGENWVGGLVGEGITIDSSEEVTPEDAATDENYVTYLWSVLTEGQSITARGVSTYFGGVRL